MPKILSETILEFRSGLALGNYKSLLLLLYVAIFARTVSLGKLKQDIGATLSFLSTFALCIFGAKYIGLFAVLSLPYLSLNCKLPISFDEAKGRIALAIAVILGVYCSVQKSPWFFENVKLIDTMEPFTICQKLATIPVTKFVDHRQVRILTHFNHGGWCKFGLMIADPRLDYRVTTDNRTQGVPEYHYEDSFNLFRLKGDWLKTLNTWNPELAVIWKDFALASAMALAPAQWEKVLEDDYFAVFKKRTT